MPENTGQKTNQKQTRKTKHNPEQESPAIADKPARRESTVYICAKRKYSQRLAFVVSATCGFPYIGH